MSFFRPEYTYELIFLIYAIVDLVIILIAAIPTIKLYKVRPKISFQEQMKIRKATAKYIKEKNYKASKIHKVLVLLLFLSLFFSCI